MKSLWTVSALCVAAAAIEAVPATSLVIFDDAGNKSPSAEMPSAREWPTSLRLRTQGGVCGATVVGPRVLLTAGHCVQDGAVGTIAVDDKYSLVSRCTVSPEYHRDPASDFALCVTEAPVLDVAPERVDLDLRRVSVGSPVKLLGYGCQHVGGPDRGSGSLATAEVRVIAAPGTDSHAIVKGDAAICFGDGGSAAFARLDDGSRVVVGVNSRGDIQSLSWIATTASESFAKWAPRWAAANDSGICGVTDRGDECVAVARDAVSPLVPRDVPSVPSFTVQSSSTTDRASSALTISASEVGTVKSLVEKNCGPQLPSFFALLTRRDGRGPTKLSAEDLVAPGDTIELPSCGPALNEAIVPTLVEVKPGDTASGLYREWSARAKAAGFVPSSRPEFEQRIVEQNPSVKQIDRLKAFDTIVLPGITPPPPGVDRIALPISSITREELKDTDYACDPAQGFGSRYASEVQQILEAMVINRNFRRERRMAQPQPVSVLVADSGLFGAGSGVFQESLMNFEGRFDEYARTVKPVKLAPKPQHGTEVSSVVLGGPLFARILAAWGGRFIRLRMVPIYSIVKREILADETNRWVLGASAEVTPGKLTELLAMARNSIRIVNLSFASAEPIDPIEAFLETPSDILLVVAAGNEATDLGEDGKEVYPAEYGGSLNDGRSNLVTVASVQSDGVIAPFSNRSHRYVELGAYGCDVPVISHDDEAGYIDTAVSGTSLSAALVSFVAALVRFERQQWTPREVKRRLLIASDLRVDQEKHIEHGRRLNIAKAVSLYEDVVEIEGGELIRGAVRFIRDGKALGGADPVFDCAGDVIRVSNVWKLVPSYRAAPDGSSTAMIYATLDERSPALFATYECAIDTTTLAIEIYSRGRTRALSWRDVVDVVMTDERAPDESNVVALGGGNTP